MLDHKANNKGKNTLPTIVHVVSYFPPHIGGMEKVAQEISLRLAKNDWPVQVVTSNVGANGDPDVENRDNYKLNRLKSFEFAHTPVMRGLMRKLLTLPRESIVHLHLAQVLVPEAVWIVSKIRKIPYIVHFHLDVNPSGPLGFLFLIYKKLFLGTILCDANKVIVTCIEQAELIKKKYFVDKAKIEIIPNGVADDLYKLKPRQLPKDSLKLLFVGRLCLQKRVDRLLEALAITKAPVDLTIVGDGEKRSSLEKQAKQLGILNRVTFVGAKTAEELVEFYQNADAFVLPSDAEAGMPLVSLEAMVSGLPVIGSNVLGIAEFIKGCGILADPTPKAFAASFDNLWQKKERLKILSTLSFKKAKKFSWENLTKKLESLYITIKKDNNVDQNKRTKFIFNRAWLTFLTLLWGSAFFVLKFFTMNSIFLNIIGFSFLMFVPGMLTYLIIKPKKGLPLFSKISLSVSFSILELITVAAVGNAVLPVFGVNRPLNSIYLSIETAILVGFLLLISWRRLANWQLDFKKASITKFKSIDWIAIMFPVAILAMSVMGAISLNNGGSNSITLIMLLVVAFYLSWLVLKSSKIKRDAITIGLYGVGLSLLLMTSMRGWYVTGHDIQPEFQVFMLAKRLGIWSLKYYQDAYNSCLSITILPTIFSNLLNIADPYIFKIFFQMIFALVPAMVYLIVGRYLKPALAVIAGIWFVAFPTYFTDMPMLNRQEIAFLFLATMLFILFEPKMSSLKKQLLIVVLGSSIAVLHYSTMYSVIAIIAFSIQTRWFLLLLKKLKIKTSLLNQEPKKPLLTFPILVVFVSASVIWGGLITNTSGGLTRVFSQTISNISNLFDKDVRSDNVGYSLFSWNKLNREDRFKGFIKNKIKPERLRYPGLYYSGEVVKKYPVKLASEIIIPISRAGNFFKEKGIDVAGFNYIFRQTTAKALQILIIFGFGFLAFTNKHLIKKLDFEFFVFAIASLFFIFLIVVLPVISTAYGLLRAFQQSLMILSLFVVVGSLMLIPKLKEKAKIIIACFLAVVFFLSTTGFITQILGGYYPQLHLNNSGSYYDLYYLNRQEIYGIKWLNNLTLKAKEKPLTQFDPFELSRIATYASFKQMRTLAYIYPDLILKEAYVFAGPQVLKRQSSFTYSGDNVTYNYPLEFLDQEKDLIYNNAKVRVYK